MARIWIVFCLLVLTTGCSRLREAAMPVADKVNAAYPVDPEVRLIQERLSALLAGQAEQIKQVQSQVDSLMTLRALNCLKGKSLGRLDSIEQARALDLERTCFVEQDTELRNLLGLRSIGVLAARPPLRPLVPLGEASLLPLGKLKTASGIMAASDAGVAMMRGYGGELHLVELPGGKLINVVGKQPNSFQLQGLSPNGRIAVVRNDDRALVFLDAETGATLWTTQDASGFAVWLPEVQAVLLSLREGGAGLLDLVQGRVVPHPLDLRRRQGAIALPGKTSSVLMMGDNEVIQVAHERRGDRIEATLSRVHVLSDDARVAYGRPQIMQSGQMLVFRAQSGLAWLDLSSGRSGVWKTTPMSIGEFIKLDETQLLFDARTYGAPQTKTWAYDIVNQTIAEVRGDTERRGSLGDLGARAGFVRRGSDWWVGDAVETDGTMKFDAFMSEYNLQWQLARLEAQSERAVAQAEQMRLSALEAVAPTSVPGLADVPADAIVHVVGIYEGGSKRHGSSNRENLWPVRVEVRSASSRPVVLALASYEPVRWIVRSGGARVAAILLAGNSGSAVISPGRERILRIGPAYAYTAGSSEYVKLKQQIMQYTGSREIRSFQGSYRGDEFSVGP